MNENKTNINWYPGHMAKTKRLIREQEKLIDVVYEIVDARIPFSSKIQDKDNLLLNKQHILIFSKYDLCDKNETKKWINYYEGLGYMVVCLDLSASKVDFSKLVEITNSSMKEIQDRRKEKGLKEKEVRALVLGVPNVGKSTFINRFANRNVASVGNKPGVTKNLVWLKTNYNILLLDTPGILWPKIESEEIGLNLASMSVIKEEILPIDKVAIHILEKLDKYYSNILLDRYGINELSDDVLDTYYILGKRIGALFKGGEVDYKRVSLSVINDIKSEKIKGITFDRYMDDEW